MMTKYKRWFFLVAIAAVGVVNIFIYWNVHLCYRTKEKIDDPEKKIRILKSANLFYPSNDSVFYELGKSYFDLGMTNLQDKSLSGEYFQKSIQHFSRSLKINPASYFCHFNLAQSLLYMSYLSPAFEGNSYEEYKKAALLAGHNSQIYYEVGKIFLSLWSKLTEEDKNFTRETLKKILEKKDRQMINAVMHIWEMNVNDYRVMEEILPEDASIYKMYAQFIGEKSLSSDERQRFLAKAELLEFERAKIESSSGESQFQYYSLKRASQSFLSSLRRLEGINFYQNLAGQELINTEDFYELKKSAYLNIAKCYLEEGGDFTQAEDYLLSYLALEDEVAAVGELESFLKLRGHIKEKFGARFDDLGRLVLQTLLCFKQNRYRDIMKVGRLLEQSFVVVPEEKKEEYVKVLQLVGDSYQKVDYIYDAGEFFRKALEVNSDDLETLLRIRQNYERLNEDDKIREIDEKKKRLLTPEKIELDKLEIKKGKKHAYVLTLDGSEIILDLYFKISEESSVTPLISVFFNDRVVWEDYLRSDEGMSQEAYAIVSLPLIPSVGKNNLVVIPVNSAVELFKIAYRRVDS
jgi:tetratricopeptide (TPR) repeat protein